MEPGIFYSLQGIKTDDPTKDHSTIKEKEKLILHYVNIPVLAKGYLIKGFHVFTGPQFGFNLSSKYDFKRGSYYQKSTDIDEMFRSFSLDLIIGTGYQFKCGFLFSCQYNLGLTNILEDGYSFTKKDNEEENVLIAKTRNSVFQVNVGWRF